MPPLERLKIGAAKDALTLRGSYSESARLEHVGRFLGGTTAIE